MELFSTNKKELFDINGKKMTQVQLRRYLDTVSVDEYNSVVKLVNIQREERAIARMNREQDPVVKERMRRMIIQEEYNFDLLFGPENNKN